MTRLEPLPDNPDWTSPVHECSLDQGCDGCEPRVEVEPDVMLGEN